MNKLEKYLKHRGISQRYFAKKIDVTPNTLGNLIKGKNMPNLRLAYVIEKETGGLVTMQDWVQEEHKKSDTETDDDCMSADQQGLK